MDPISLFLSKLEELGFFKFIVPWLFFTSLFYALIKKSKLLGETKGIDLPTIAISLSVSFAFLYAPIATGLDVGPVFSRFLMQLSIFFLIFIFGVVGAAIMYPDLSKVLKEKMVSRNTLWIFVVITLLSFVTSGMLDLYLKIPGGKVTPQQQDIYTLITGLIIMIVVFVIAGYVAYYFKVKGGKD